MLKGIVMRVCSQGGQNGGSNSGDGNRSNLVEGMSAQSLRSVLE